MASVAEINATIGVNTNAAATQPIKQQTLGQEEFFKLLTTQLASQDPLKPMEDTAFIAQMAQFSSLEMQNQLNKNFSQFSESQVFSSAQSMIGRNVSLLNNGQEIYGRAQGIEAADGITRVFIDGVGYNAAGVFRIEEDIPLPTATTSKQVPADSGSGDQSETSNQAPAEE